MKSKLVLAILVIAACVIAEMALFAAIIQLQNEEDATATVTASAMESATAKPASIRCVTTWTHQPEYVSKKGRVLLAPNMTYIWTNFNFRLIGWRDVPGTRVISYEQRSPTWGVLTWQTPEWGQKEHAKAIVELFIGENGDNLVTWTVKCSSKWWPEPEPESGFGHLNLGPQ